MKKLNDIIGKVLCLLGIHDEDENAFEDAFLGGTHEDFVDRDFNPCKRCGRYIYTNQK